MIKHILADGTEIENIKGRIIPPTGKTEAVYRLVARVLASSGHGVAAEEKRKVGNA